MRSYNVCVILCNCGTLRAHETGVTLVDAPIVTAKTNILEGLHVLLVSEDEARIASLAKALRDRKASVGDVKAKSRESLALRGADLVVVDTRSTESTRSSVNEMRNDVRARWASITLVDYSRLVLEDGSVVLGALETEVAPLVTADRDLTERARNEESFEVSLRPLGPSRMLRALAAAGPTMHLDIIDDTLTGAIDLSNELLVCAFAERGGSEKWEAWTALVRILGLLDATVKVSRRSHPTAMNIMEPIDQALEVAAQERHSTAAQIAIEERAARARVAVDFATTGAHPAMRPDGTLVKLVPEPESLPAPAVTPAPAATTTAKVVVSAAAKPPPKRTLLGLSAPLVVPPPSATVKAAAAPPLPAPLERSRYAYHGDSAPEERVKPGRTLLGVVPGGLPTFGGPPRPVMSLAPPNLARAGAKALPSLPNSAAVASPVVEQASAAAGAGHFAVDSPTAKHPGMLEVARSSAAVGERDWAGEMLNAARQEAQTVQFEAVDDDEVQATSLPESEPPDSLGEDQAPSMASPNELLQFLGNKGDNDAVPDLPEEVTEEPPFSEPPMSAPPAMVVEVHPNLLEAIGEEVATAAFSGPPGAKPIEQAVKPPRQIVPAAITRFVRKPRTLALLVLLLVTVSEYYLVVWSERRSDELAAKVSTAASPSRPKPAAPATPPKAAAPAGTEAAAQAATPAAVAPTNAAPTVAENAAAPAVQAAAPAPTKIAEPAPPEPAAPVAVSPPEVDATSDVDGFVREAAKLLAAGNAAGAREEFARAVAGDARNPHARAGLAEAMLALSQPQDALTQVEEAIKLRPKRARYRVLQGDALLALGKASQARDAFRKALELDPSDRDASKRLGK